MLTPAPTDPLLLPSHQPRTLAAEERAALGPVQWEMELPRSLSPRPTKSKPRPYWRGRSAEGIWSVAARGEGRDRTCWLSFFPKLSLEEREAHEAILSQDAAGTVEWHLAYGRTNQVEMGYAFTPELAMGLADLMRYQEPGVDAAAALAEAGFQEDPPSQFAWARSNPNDPTKHYTKRFNRHALTLSVGPYGCKLEFHRRGSHYHLNLYHIQLVKAACDGKVFPMVWPGVVAEPASVALIGALQAAKEFEAQETARAVLRKQPSSSSSQG